MCVDIMFSNWNGSIMCRLLRSVDGDLIGEHKEWFVDSHHAVFRNNKSVTPLLLLVSRI